jgi:hypothetical protein
MHALEADETLQRYDGRGFQVAEVNLSYLVHFYGSGIRQPEMQR